MMPSTSLASRPAEARAAFAAVRPNRKIVDRTVRQARTHAVNVHQTAAIEDVAVLDSRCLDDEFLAGGLHRVQLSGVNRAGIFSIEALDIGIENLNQLCIADCGVRGVPAR